MAKKKVSDEPRVFTSKERTSTKDLSQDEIDTLIDKGVTVGSRRIYFHAKGGTKRSENLAKTTGLRPASKHVAEAYLAGHITASEATDLNHYYKQHVPEKEPTAPKEPKVKKTSKAKKPKVAAEPATEIRIVNGREFKVTKLSEDTAATQRAREAQVNMYYRAKEGRY